MNVSQGRLKASRFEKCTPSMLGIGRDFLERFPAQSGDFFGREFRVRWLAGFTTKGNGGKVGTVGLHHVAVGRNGPRRLLHERGIFEGDDAGERNNVSHFRDLRGGFGRPTEAMEDRAQPTGVGAENVHGIPPSFALVDDHVESELHGQIELRFEGFGLGRFHGTIGNIGLGRFSRSGQQRVEDSLRLVAPRQIAAGKVVVVQSGFPDGHDFRVIGQIGQLTEEIHGALIKDVARMESDDGINIVVLFGDGQRLAATLPIDADGDDAVHSLLAGPGDDGIELSVELREVEMRVGIGQHGCYQRTTAEAQVNPPPKTTMRMWSPRLMRLLRCASSRAIATAAAEVLP